MWFLWVKLNCLGLAISTPTCLISCENAGDRRTQATFPLGIGGLYLKFRKNWIGRGMEGHTVDPLISLALGEQRQENQRFEISLGYLRPCLKTIQTSRDGVSVERTGVFRGELEACLLELKVARSLPSHLSVPRSTCEVLAQE